jgi:hypothetical protein
MVAWTLAGRESALGVLGRWLQRRRREVGAFLVIAVRAALVVTGFTAPVVGIWLEWGTPAGLIAAGPAALIVEYFVKRR